MYIRGVNILLMDLISITGLIVSAASLGLDLFDRIQSHNVLNKINTAYQTALKKWCRNNDIRSRISSNFLNFEGLVHYIQQSANTDLPREYGSFLKVWETELRNDSQTYSFLLEILSRQNVDLSQVILKTQHDTQDQIGQGFAKTHGLLAEIKNEIHKLDKPNIYAERKYGRPVDYIGRTVRDYPTIDAFQHLLNPDSYKSRPLIDYLLQYKKIALYSEAQEGKSTELQNLAYETQNSDLFQVVFYDLRYYTGQTLMDELPFDYLTTDSSKRGILILDGLDEIKDDIRGKTIRQIEQISSSYSDLYVVVSCRGNFESTNSVFGFTKLYLNPLEYQDVETYLQKHCSCSDELLALIREKELYELTYNPFYLKSILKYFEQNQRLPDTKSAIYDYVIENSFEIDQERAKGGVIAVKEEAILLLQKVAFCLQFSERQFFDFEQLHSEIGLSHEEIEKCCNYTIFKKNSANHYTFTHNAFREYLTAKRLAGTTFELLKNAICYPETEILRPNLYNTILLLIGILDPNIPLLKSLIEWLATENPEVLFMCENHFLNDKRCTEVFKAYYEHMGQCEKLIEFLKYERTMRFANNREAILFLHKKIEQNPEVDTNLSNAISLLQYADITLLNQQEQNKFIQTAFALLNSHKEDRDHISRIFDLFRNPYFRTPEFIREIHDIIKDNENPILLNEFFGIIEKAALADEYIDWIIDRRKHIRNFDEKGAIRIVDEYPLADVLSSVNTIENIIHILPIFNDRTWYIHNDKRTRIYISLFDKLQRQVGKFTQKHWNQLIKHIFSDESFSSHDNLGIIQTYRSFFITNGYDESVFNQYYTCLKKELKSSDQNNHLWSCLNVISTLMTDSRFDQIEQDAELTEQQRHTIINRMGIYPAVSENLKWLERIHVWQDRYFPKRMDLQKSAQDGFDILFDYERFKAETNTVAQSHETFTHNWECCFALSQEGVNESLIAFIDDYEIRQDATEVPSKEVVEALQNIEKFEQFRLRRLEHYTRSKISVTEEQKHRISEFIEVCINATAWHNTNVLIAIISSYEIKLDDTKLIALLPYSTWTINNDPNPNIHQSYNNLFLKYIETHISDRNLLESAIEELIKNDKYFSAHLYCILTLYIVQNQLNKLYRYFEIILFHEVNEQHESVVSYRSSIIEIVLQLGNDGMRRLETFKDRFDNIVKIHYYNYIFMNDNLTPNDEEIEADLLLMYPTITEDYKGDILALLLRIGSTVGLDLFVDYYKQNQLILHYFRPAFGKYDGTQVDQIKQIFESDQTNDWDIRDSIRNSAFSWLNNWALESKYNNDYILNYYHQLIELDSEKYRYLRFYANQIKNKYYETQSPTMSISDALSFYDQVA